MVKPKFSTMEVLPCSCGNSSLKLHGARIDSKKIMVRISCKDCGKSAEGYGVHRKEAEEIAISEWNRGKSPTIEHDNRSHEERIIDFLAEKLAAISGNINDNQVTADDVIAWAERNISE